MRSQLCDRVRNGTAESDVFEAMIQLIVETQGVTTMVKDLNRVLLPDHPMYADAVEAMRRYHQAQAEDVSEAEVERLRLLAEHSFQAVTDYQLRALGGPSETSH